MTTKKISEIRGPRPPIELFEIARDLWTSEDADKLVSAAFFALEDGNVELAVESVQRAYALASEHGWNGGPWKRFAESFVLHAVRALETRSA